RPSARHDRTGSGRGGYMQSRRLCAFLVAAACASGAAAAPPAFRPAACPVKLDGVRVGTDLTAGNSSLRNSIAYEPSTKTYHFWGFAADDANFPSLASALPSVVHATSGDGLHFVSDAPLGYGIGAAHYTDFAAALDPPLDFFRAVF